MKKSTEKYPENRTKHTLGLVEEELMLSCDSLLNGIGQHHTLFSHKDGILHFVSDGIIKISQKEPQEVIGQHFKDILHWTDESIALHLEQCEKIINQEIRYVELEMDSRAC